TLLPVSVLCCSSLSAPIRPPSEVFRLGDISNEGKRGHYHSGATGISHGRVLTPGSDEAHRDFGQRPSGYLQPQMAVEEDICSVLKTSAGKTVDDVSSAGVLRGC